VDREAAEWQALFTMVLLTSFVLVIGLIMVVGDYGWLAIQQLEVREQQLQAELVSMQADEERLRRKVVALRSDPVYLEATARTMLGLAKPAERILRLPESLRVEQAETRLARLSR
jgi:cell division protein FtsB